MNKLYNILIIAALFLSFSACRKDVDVFIPYTNSTDDIKLLLKQVPDASLFTTLSPGAITEDTDFYTSSGAVIHLVDPDHLFQDPQNNPVLLSNCPNFRIEITEAYKKGDWLARGLNAFNTDGQLLAPEVFFAINFYCGSTRLSLVNDRDISVYLPVSNPEVGFLKYQSAVAPGNTLNWATTNEAVFKAEWPNPNAPTETLEGYEVLVTKMGWNGVAKMANTAQGTAANCIQISEPNNFENTLAFAVIPNARAVIALSKDAVNNRFCSDGLPVGQPLQFILVSKVNGQYFIGDNTVQSQTDGIFTVAQQPSNTQEILNYIRDL